MTSSWWHWYLSATWELFLHGDIHYGQKNGISGKHIRNSRILHFDLLEMTWHQPQTIKYCEFDVTLTCNVMDEKCLQCPKLKIHNRTYKIYYHLILRLIFFHSFLGIHYYIVNLWKICGHSIICHLHHAQFPIDHRITIWMLKQNDRKCDSRGSILSFDNLTKICLICMNNVYWKFRTTWFQ